MKTHRLMLTLALGCLLGLQVPAQDQIVQPHTEAQPRIIGVSLQTDSVTLDIEAVPGLVYQAQGSINLVDWANLGWVSGGHNGWCRFVDSDRALYPSRFYRIVQSAVPRVRIAVFSDPHYMHPNLLISDGPAFQEYLLYDQKPLRESAAILDSAITNILSAQPDIVLIPGDLTKDGELVSHQGVASVLQRLRRAGLSVLVCPGNHDVANPQAMAFDGTTAFPVPSVTPAQFEAIYQDFGYGTAIARDPNSLAYVAEPVAGLWILAMDACRYDPNAGGRSRTGGHFDATRWNWITNQLALGRAQGKWVLGVVHHGVTEHYEGQESLFPEYVLDDYELVRDTLARYGVRAVFTGHYHAHDIAKFEHQTGPLFDIETGSLVTYPNPFRIIDLAPSGVMSIQSKQVTTINYDLGGLEFPSYSYNSLTNGFMSAAMHLLMLPPYNLPDFAAQLLAPALTEAFVSHCQGDESTRPISPQTQELIDVFLEQEDPLVQSMAAALLAHFNDPPPADNNVTINLITGEVLP